MTERVSIRQTGLSDYAVTVPAELLAGSPLMRRVFNHYWDYNLQRSIYRIGDGSLTRHSRAEVARITRRLNGRMKP